MVVELLAVPEDDDDSRSESVDWYYLPLMAEREWCSVEGCGFVVHLIAKIPAGVHELPELWVGP
jgi:hypothetical protein